jgi:plastocyanin
MTLAYSLLFRIPTMDSKKTLVRRISFTVMSFGFVALLSSCGGNTDANPSSNHVLAPIASPSPGSMVVNIPMGAVGQGPAAFGQNPLTIAPGTTVTWTNQDDMPHTTTSDTGLWDSGLMQPGQSYSFQFTGGGTFPYHCQIHGEASMSGTIQVTGPVASPTPSPSPSASTLAPTFTNMLNTALVPHCLACHEGPNPSAGLDFSTYQNLVHNTALPTLVVPGNPDSSALYQEILGGGIGTEALTAQETQLVQDWIQDGALNN